jgi:hypothetical protein
VHSHAFGFDAIDDRGDHLYLVMYASGRYGHFFYSLASAIESLRRTSDSGSVWLANRLIATYSPFGGVNDYSR